MIVTSRKSNIGKMTVRTRQRAAAVVPAVLRAEELSGRAMVKRARALSQGFLRTATLRALGHPYKIGGEPIIDPAILNRQSGNLQWRWQSRVTFNGRGTQLTLWNTAWYAQFLATGTAHSIPRPILDAVIRLEQGARIARLRAAQREVMKK